MRRKLFPIRLLLTGIVTSLIFIATSCGDDDDNGGEDTSKDLLLSELTYNGEITSIEYDNQNRPTKIVQTEDNENNATTFNISYDTDGNLISDGLFDYEYKDDYVLKVDKSLPNYPDTLYVNNKGQLAKYAGYVFPYQSINETAYEYDSRGNLIQMKIEVDFLSTTGVITKYTNSFSYTYDSKNGALSKANIPSWAITNFMSYQAIYVVNNCLSFNHTAYIYVNGELNQETPTSYNLIYNYNSDDYPTNVAGGSIVFKYIEAN